jgi:hypothetical protein
MNPHQHDHSARFAGLPGFHEPRRSESRRDSPAILSRCGRTDDRSGAIGVLVVVSCLLLSGTPSPGKATPSISPGVDTPKAHTFVTVNSVPHDRARAPFGSNLTFQESGLPSGTLWKATVNQTTLTSTSSSLTFLEPNGSYRWSVPGFLSSPSSGIVSVSGRPVVVPIGFATPLYQVNFQETGLPSGSRWGVLLNGTLNSSIGASVGFWMPNGSYPFVVGATPGFYASPNSGRATVLGPSPAQSIRFSSFNFSVTVFESGLPPKALWSVAFHGLVYSSATSQIVLGMPNGTHSLSVTPVPGFVAIPPSLMVIVSAAPNTTSVLFVPQLSIRSFTTSTSAPTVGEAFVLSVSVSGGSAPYSYEFIQLPAGCHTSSSSTLPCTSTSSGTFQVTVRVVDSVGQVANATLPVAVQAKPGGTLWFGLSSWVLWAGIGSAAVVFGALAALTFMRRKRSSAELAPPARYRPD